MTEEPSPLAYVPRGSGRVPEVGLEIPGYRVQREIGSGGMGVVYQGIDLERRRVAIKILRSHIAHDPLSRERLAREVAALSKVRHRGVARILDAELDDDHAFLVTEYVDGPTLDDVVRKNGPMHPRVVIEIGVLMAETLQEIHRADIIHRDLKPSNVMLDAVDELALQRWDSGDEQVSPVIIDFGLAHAKSESRLTATGLVMGTAAYIDPEVILGCEPSAIADWWSWAATLAFIATGQAPFGNAAADVMIARVRSEKPKVQELPHELREFFTAAFKADIADRPSPHELVSWLKNVNPDADLTTPVHSPRPSSTPTRSMYPIGPQADPLSSASSVATGQTAPADVSGASWQGRGGGARPALGTLAHTPAAGHSVNARASNGQTGNGHTGSNHSVAGPHSGEYTSGGVRRYPEPPNDYLKFNNKKERPATPPRSVRSSVDVTADAIPANSAGQPRGHASHRAPVDPRVGSQFAAQTDTSDLVTDWPGSSTTSTIPPNRFLRFVLPCGMLTLCLVGAVVPVVACVVAWMITVVMIVVAFNRKLLAKRRAEGGPRRSDLFVASLASPWHALKGILVALGMSLVPAICCGLVATGLYYGLGATGNQVPGALCFLVGMSCASWLAWWGIRRGDLRLGTRQVVEALGRRRRGPEVVLVIFAILAAAVIVVAITSGGTTDLWPFQYKLQSK